MESPVVARIARRATALVAALALLGGTAVAATAPDGTWSGVARHGFNGDTVPSLPVTFRLEHGVVSDLTVGPARLFACEPWSESGVASVRTALPKLTGFPAEKLQHGDEFDYSFVRKGARFRTTTSLLIPRGPEFVSFDAYLDGRKFGQLGAVITVTFGATSEGTISSTGPLGCIGNWSNWFAAPR